MNTREQLLAEIEAFLAERKMSATRFGQEATGDRALLITLRRGRVPQVTTVDKIRAYMARERKKATRSKSRPKRRSELRRQVALSA